MPHVTLDRLWIHDAADLDTYLRFYTADRTDPRTKNGSVRGYANGRNRVITVPGAKRNLQVTLRLVTSANLETLEDWRGTLVMVRDHLGDLFFATFFTVTPVAYKDRSGYDVAVTFEDATHTVEV